VNKTIYIHWFAGRNHAFLTQAGGKESKLESAAYTSNLRGLSQNNNVFA
jgi:hypothetical protein